MSYSVRTDFATALAAYEPLTELVGDRVYPAYASQGAAYPYIVFSSSTEADLRHTRNRRTKTRCDKINFYVSVISDDIDQAYLVAEAIDEAIDGQDTEHATGWKYVSQDESSDNLQDESGKEIHELQLNIICHRRSMDIE